jgi:enoyl-CoA hydratase/carnithine racemase
MSDPIRIVREDRLARLVLDRPEKRNALDLSMWRAIPAALETLRGDERLRVLVVEGTGAHFAAGADIAEFEAAYRTREDAIAHHKTMMAAMSALEAFPAPTLALVRGSRVGGGLGLALCADFRFAQEGARFGITTAKLGLAYGLADTRRLVAAVGWSNARRILYTGRLMEGAEALSISLVDRLGPDVSSLEAELFAELAAASGQSARSIKRVFAKLADGATDDDAESRALFAEAFFGPDHREGVAAFHAKRPPDFA